MSGPDETPGLRNRAATSKSPYINDFVDSAVDWQLLDDEALELAKQLNRPIFLHIGYKACHFCFLSIIDAFSHPQCAQILNASFVPVIVDRDERPDIDSVYLNYVQGVYQRAGWPLNLFLTPELEPIYGDTYIPGPGSEHAPESEGDDSKNFLKVLRHVAKVWTEQETRCRREAAGVISQLRDYAAEGTLGTRSLTASTTLAGAAASASSPAANHAGGGFELGTQNNHTELDLDELELAYSKLAGTFDPTYAGFGLSPKHITAPKLAFLLRLGRFPMSVQHVVGEEDCERAADMVLKTLRQIRDGALRDHVGGQGFGRYSVTADWSVPCFERLVPENAVLLGLFVDAWLVAGKGRGTRETEFYDVLVELADYLASAPIRLPGGAFATAESADSFARRGDRQRKEGAYHVWTRREFDDAVGNAGATGQGDGAGGTLAALAAAYWNVLEDGNIDAGQDPHDEFVNQNVLRVAPGVDRAELGRQVGVSAAEVDRLLALARSRLAAHRESERVRPELDGKVIAAYNGLVISALANAGAALQGIDAERGNRYIQAASAAAQFLRTEMWDAENKVLYRIWRDGVRGETRGFAVDYAFVIDGLLDLFEASGAEQWVRWADELQAAQIKYFYDSPRAASLPSDRSPCGGFFMTEPGAPHVLLRLKDGMDTALPSTNAISMSNLFRLAALLDEPAHAVLARETVTAFEVEMLQHPWLYPGLLAGVVKMRLGGRTWAILGQPDELGAKVARHVHTSPAGGLVNLVAVPEPGTQSWLVGRNRSLSDLAGQETRGCFFFEGGRFRPATEEDLVDDPQYED